MLTFNIGPQTRKKLENTRTWPTPLSEKQASLLRNVLDTREARRILGTVIPEVITVWAGKSRIKRWIAAIINKILRLGFLQPGDGKYTGLLEDAELIKDAGPVAALMTEGADKLADVCSAAFQSMSVEEKAHLLQGVVRGLFNGRSGSLATQMVAALNQIHEQDPEFLARALEPGVNSWVAKTDFGELKTLASKSSQDFKALIRVVNESLWQYPAKVILLLALLPDAANMLVTGVKDTVARFNEISPDVVTDITLTMLKEIDGEALGQGINELTELIRKLSVGSALIGEPGFPRIPKDTSQLLEDILNTLDGEKWLKSGMILAEQKQMLNQCLLDQLKDQPELLLKKWGQYPNLKNVKLRTLHHKLSILDDIPDAAVSESVIRGLSDIDTDTLTDIIHLIVAVINRTHDLQPEVIPGLVSKLIDGLDLDLIAESSENLLDAIMPDLVYLGRPFLPRMINGFCDAMEPQDDDYDSDIAEARKRLGQLLTTEEV